MEYHLDLMDLRAIIQHQGASTMLVGTGHHDQLEELYNATIKAPLAPMNVAGAKGCLLQIEGGQIFPFFLLGMHFSSCVFFVIDTSS